MDKKILIVDDAGFARKVMKRALKESNFTNIVEAKNAKEAIELFVQENPDLTILDISLPDNHDLSLLKNMMEKNSKAKIIMCSALSQNKIMLDAIKMGAVDFICKPFINVEFVQVVTKHLLNQGD